jgi:hypothetical protein
VGKVGERAELSSPLFPWLCPDTRYRYGRLLPTVVGSWLRVYKLHLRSGYSHCASKRQCAYVGSWVVGKRRWGWWGVGGHDSSSTARGLQAHCSDYPLTQGGP